MPARCPPQQRSGRNRFRPAPPACCRPIGHARRRCRQPVVLATGWAGAARTLTRPATVRATSRSACAARDSSPPGYCAEVIGTPASPPDRTPGSIGIRPRTSISSSADAVAAAATEEVARSRNRGRRSAHVLDHADASGLSPCRTWPPLRRPHADLQRGGDEHGAVQRNDWLRLRAASPVPGAGHDQVASSPLDVAQELGDGEWMSGRAR